MANLSVSGSIQIKNVATTNYTVSIPAGHAIRGIYMANSTANAVTGGIKIGTTNGGTEVVAAQAVGANAVLGMTDADILLKYFSPSGATTLFIQTVTDWNSASVTITFDLYPVGA